MTGRRVAERDERCRRSGCPNYIGPSDGPAVNSNGACAFCSGPVVWTDASGVRRGATRACTSCPMNGRGLPVCWAACPGPNEALGTYGQNMVTLGGMADESGFISRHLEEDYRRGRKESADSWVDGIGEEESPAPARDRKLFILQRLLDADGRTFGRIAEMLEAGMPRRAAELVGIPAGMARDLAAVMDAVRGVRPAQWDVVRHIAMGETQAKVAEMLGVRKQAVNQNLRRMCAKSPWIGVLLEWVKPMSRSDMRRGVDNNRGGARASVATLSHGAGGAVKKNLPKNAESREKAEKRGVTNRK